MSTVRIFFEEDHSILVTVPSREEAAGLLFAVEVRFGSSPPWLAVVAAPLPTQVGLCRIPWPEAYTDCKPGHQLSVAVYAQEKAGAFGTSPIAQAVFASRLALDDLDTELTNDDPTRTIATLVVGMRAVPVPPDNASAEAFGFHTMIDRQIQLLPQLMEAIVHPLPGEPSFVPYLVLACRVEPTSPATADAGDSIGPLRALWPPQLCRIDLQLDAVLRRLPEKSAGRHSGQLTGSALAATVAACRVPALEISGRVVGRSHVPPYDLEPFLARSVRIAVLPRQLAGLAQQLSDYQLNRGAADTFVMQRLDRDGANPLRPVEPIKQQLRVSQSGGGELIVSAPLCREIDITDVVAILHDQRRVELELTEPRAPEVVHEGEPAAEPPGADPAEMFDQDYEAHEAAEAHTAADDADEYGGRGASAGEDWPIILLNAGEHLVRVPPMMVFDVVAGPIKALLDRLVQGFAKHMASEHDHLAESLAELVEHARATMHARTRWAVSGAALTYEINSIVERLALSTCLPEGLSAESATGAQPTALHRFWRQPTTTDLELVHLAARSSPASLRLGLLSVLRADRAFVRDQLRSMSQCRKPTSHLAAKAWLPLFYKTASDELCDWLDRQSPLAIARLVARYVEAAGRADRYQEISETQLEKVWRDGRNLQNA